MNTITIPGLNPWIMLLIVLWTIPWKGIALWKAARLSHKWWFVVLLILNTVGILEIIYIFLIARKYTVETERSDVDEPIRSSVADIVTSSNPVSPVPTKPAQMTSVSQTVKTTEVKTVVTSPEKESPKVETKKDVVEEMKSDSSEK